jgi:hypothetical protein
MKYNILILNKSILSIEFLKNKTKKTPAIIKEKDVLPKINFPNNSGLFEIIDLKNPILYISLSEITTPDKPAIPFKTLMASSHSFALKNTHATFTKLNVINQANHVHILNPRFDQTL